MELLNENGMVCVNHSISLSLIPSSWSLFSFFSRLIYGLLLLAIDETGKIDYLLESVS
jgi:hypothetical protein